MSAFKPLTSSRERQRRPWLTPRFVMFLLLATVLGLLLARYLYLDRASVKWLRETLAETDRLDPGWRLEELELKRRAVADADNSATQVQVVQHLLPPSWPEPRRPYPLVKMPPERSKGMQELESALESLEAPVQLDADQIRAARGELEKASAALAEARKLADLPRGRPAIHWELDFLSTLLPHLQASHVTALLLRLDALLRAQDGDLDAALASCRAALNAGRSIGDEPLLVSQLVREKCQELALRGIERTLAQGQPAAASLNALRKALEAAPPESGLLNALRGERANLDRTMSALQAGKLTLSQVTDSPRKGFSRFWSDTGTPLLLPGFIRNNRAAILEYMTQAVEAAKLPLDQQDGPFEELHPPTDRHLVLAWLYCHPLKTPAQTLNAGSVELRCAIVGVALEAYRQAHGRWPDSLASLVPAQLGKTPLDPYGRAPLRYRRLDDGVVIYSLGPDRKDDGGTLDSPGRSRKGTDLGFRLWDVPYRRQRPDS